MKKTVVSFLLAFVSKLLACNSVIIITQTAIIKQYAYVTFSKFFVRAFKYYVD